MFQFTTTHVINSTKDLNTGLDLIVAKDEVLSIKGINNFKKENILDIHKTEAKDAKSEELTVDLSGISASKGDTLRLTLYIRLTASDDCSYYANNFQHKGRPFTVEFPWLGNATDTAANLEKIINKYGLLVFEKKVVNVKVSGNTVVLTAVNEFQRFHVAKLEKFIESEKPFGEKWEEVGSVEVTVPGVEGFGDYGWILRNLKLPTHEHTRAFAPKSHEMPIPGGKYNQYTIQYCADRGPLGMNAVGQNVKSVTTHVLYILQGEACDAFEAAAGLAQSTNDED